MPNSTSYTKVVSLDSWLIDAFYSKSTFLHCARTQKNERQKEKERDKEKIHHHTKEVTLLQSLTQRKANGPVFRHKVEIKPYSCVNTRLSFGVFCCLSLKMLDFV